MIYGSLCRLCRCLGLCILHLLELLSLFLSVNQCFFVGDSLLGCGGGFITIFGNWRLFHDFETT